MPEINGGCPILKFDVCTAPPTQARNLIFSLKMYFQKLDTLPKGFFSIVVNCEATVSVFVMNSRLRLM